MEDLALGRALTVAVRLLVDDMHERLAAQGFDDLRPAFGYVLNAVANASMSASDVAVLLGMTKQGAAKLLAEMEHAGYIVRTSSPDDGRTRPVGLTTRVEQRSLQQLRHNTTSSAAGSGSAPLRMSPRSDGCSTR